MRHPLLSFRKAKYLAPTPLLVAFFIFVFLFFLFFLTEAVRAVLNDGIRLAKSSVQISGEEELSIGYMRAIKDIFYGIMSGGAQDGAQPDQKEFLSLLKKMRERILKLTGIPEEFKNVHLYAVLTIGRFIENIENGKAVELKDFRKSFENLYNAL